MAWLALALTLSGLVAFATLDTKYTWLDFEISETPALEGTLELDAILTPISDDSSGKSTTYGPPYSLRFLYKYAPLTEGAFLRVDNAMLFDSEGEAHTLKASKTSPDLRDTASQRALGGLVALIGREANKPLEDLPHKSYRLRASVSYCKPTEASCMTEVVNFKLEPRRKMRLSNSTFEALMGI